jgi:aspirochlorine biosynthesis cytochrome P450 monooxygenase
MRLIISRVFWNFDLEIMPDSLDWMKYQKSYQLWEKSELNVKINLRKE